MTLFLLHSCEPQLLCKQTTLPLPLIALLRSACSLCVCFGPFWFGQGWGACLLLCEHTNKKRSCVWRAACVYVSALISEAGRDILAAQA